MIFLYGSLKISAHPYFTYLWKAGCNAAQERNWLVD